MHGKRYGIITHKTGNTSPYCEFGESKDYSLSIAMFKPQLLCLEIK